MDKNLSEWLGSLDPDIHAKIAKAGWVDVRALNASTVSALLEEYFDALEVKDGTETAYGHTKRNLGEFFGKDKPLAKIDGKAGSDFRRWLKDDQKLSDATTSRRIGVARMIFGKAVKWKLIAENPFEDVKTGSQTNKARQFDITRQMADLVMAACPDAQWKLLFALSRYGGLRCPSEHLALKWGDVNWDDKRGRIRVPSSKTEHHQGHEERFIPLWPEIREPLQAVFDEAPEGSEYVITRYRDGNSNLRTQFHRIIRRAGLVPWPKTFHNLRSSRQTELEDAGWPSHVVCAWLGNSTRVARDHYLQLTEAHFEKALATPVPHPPAVQKAAHSARVSASQSVSSDDAGAKTPGKFSKRRFSGGGVWARQDSNL